MRTIVKYFITMSFILYLKIQRAKENSQPILRIDNNYTKKLFITFVQSILQSDQEYYSFDYTTNTDYANLLYDIDIYSDKELDKILNILFEKADFLVIKYKKLIRDIKTFLTISTINNQIKSCLKQKNKYLKIFDGNFTKFIDENMDNDDGGFISLKHNRISYIIKKFDDFLDKTKCSNEIYGRNIINSCMDYTRIADFYLNMLKLSMINSFDEDIIKNKFKINIESCIRALRYMNNEEYLFLNGGSVGATLSYYLHILVYNTDECPTFKEYLKKLRIDIIHLKFKIVKTFTTKDYINTNEFCLYNEELETILISKITSYEVKAGCIDATFKCLHESLCSCFFNNIVEYIYLSITNSYYSDSYLIKGFKEKVKLINAFKIGEENVNNVSWLAIFLTSTFTDAV